MELVETDGEVADWYYLDAFNQPQGPFTAGTIGSMAHCSDFYVCKAGFDEWVLASEAKLPSQKSAARVYHLKSLPDESSDKKPARRKRASPAVNLDKDGQPQSAALNAVQNVGKSLDGLYGICRGLLIDGDVSENECRCLQSWLDENASVADMWPANVIASRLRAAFSDQKIDDDERSDIRLLLEKAIGGRPSVDDCVTLATRLPLTEPFPDIGFAGQSFCFTGKFAYGSRAKCGEAVFVRGGRVEDTVIVDLDFLVIGITASRDWAHSSHGRKIETARKRNVKIVSEEHWVQCLAL